MGTEEAVVHRVVFDTGVVVSALLFQHGELAWLRRHWAAGECTPLLSRATAGELLRVLAYPKFGLSAGDRDELLGEYLVYCKLARRVKRCPVHCRDQHDQAFLDLAHTAQAEALVTGDRDLLSLTGEAPFPIESPAAYRERVERR
ncbi:MAG: putative toxin-antitoxin system toxin component, PIN family [Candidatus Bipolaricaulota bacterium]